MVVAPPDSFLGDDSATPTPMLDNESLDSGKSTPIIIESPSMDSLAGKSSPLVVAQYRSSDDQIHRTDRESPDSSADQRIEAESSRQSGPLSPLAKTFYSSQNTEQSAKSVSQSKGLSIYPSSQHDCQPQQHSTDEEDIVSYKLSRESTNTSKESEVSPGRVQRRVEGYERKLHTSTKSEGSSVGGPSSSEHEHLGNEGTDL